MTYLPTIHPTLYWACDYLSMLRIKLNHVSKRGHYWCSLLLANLTLSFKVTFLALGYPLKTTFGALNISQHVIFYEYTEIPDCGTENRNKLYYVFFLFKHRYLINDRTDKPSDKSLNMLLNLYQLISHETSSILFYFLVSNIWCIFIEIKWVNIFELYVLYIYIAWKWK